MQESGGVGSTSGDGRVRWYALSPDEVAGRLGVDPEDGLAAAKASELLQTDGPNALPAEQTQPGWRRLLEQYAAYMQIILLIAGVLSAVALFFLSELGKLIARREAPPENQGDWSTDLADVHSSAG